MTSSNHGEDDLTARFPRTAVAFAAMQAHSHLARIAQLDAAWDDLRQPAPLSAAPHDHQYTIGNLNDTALDGSYDLVYAGGGLGLLHAAVMAQRYGQRVLLFDRGEVGCAHREWNISRGELAELVRLGLCSWDELRPIIMAEYTCGVVRFYAGPTQPPAELWLRNVLDLALDAGALLRLARRKLEQAGGIVLDHRSFAGLQVAPGDPLQVVVTLRRADGTSERYGARLLLDGMGSTSPLALRRFAGQPFAGVCPTVGTVVSGLVAGTRPEQHQRQIGDVLVSVADAQRGQQYLWEGFPGRADELTVYLFYYDTLQAPAARAADHQRRSAPGLLQLFEDYFALLPEYKQPGPQFRHLRPVYGYIPARHSLRHQEAPLLPGVLPVGDSAAQQSPLTFCGFGSHVRNLDRTTSLLDHALRHGLTRPHDLRLISPYQVNVSLNWVFSRFMQPWGAPTDVNRLQGVFLDVLNALGEPHAQRFFRDQMVWGDYHRMLNRVFLRYPQIVPITWRVLGPAGICQWIGDYLAYSRTALLAGLGRAAGPAGRHALLRIAGRISPALGLRLQAHLAEWRVMGWL